MKYIITALIITALGISCDMPETTVGSMNLSINNVDGRSLLPDISMDADSYSITGMGPGDNTFTLDTSAEQNLVEDLSPGDWNISIDALNLNGLIIGQGSGSVTVVRGETTAVNITVTPLSGTGMIDLGVLWDTADLANPVISARLVPYTGTEIIPVFTESVPGSSNSSTTVGSGYYTLILQLLDTDEIVMGAVETVRIAAEQITSGSFDFTEVNSIGGSIDIGIDVDLDNPIEVSLAGTLDTMVMGSSMSVTASAPLETESINYFWYVNGSPSGTGSIVTIGSSLNPGVYRLDVIAIMADGSRSGSTNHTFTVTAE